MAVPLAKAVPLGWRKRWAKKWGPCLGTGAPSDAFPFVGVVFTPTRGVIHPSFPLRGRWERTLKRDEQAPSPSLIALLNSSSETRQHRGLMHELRHLAANQHSYKYSLLCYLACRKVKTPAPNRSSNSIWNCVHDAFGNGVRCRQISLFASPQLQNNASG
jgi:hypothetical protein